MTYLKYLVAAMDPDGGWSFYGPFAGREAVASFMDAMDAAGATVARRWHREVVPLLKPPARAAVSPGGVAAVVVVTGTLLGGYDCFGPYASRTDAEIAARAFSKPVHLRPLLCPAGAVRGTRHT